jgi:integrase
MSSIKKRDHGRWRARYRDARGKEHARHFGRKVDAQSWLDSVAASVQTQTDMDPAKGKVKIGLWADRWLAGPSHLKPSPYERYAGVVRKYIDPHWGDVPLENLSHADIQAWVSALTVQHSPSTALKAHRVLSLMLSLAVRDGRLARNPAAEVRLPREVQTDRRYLSHDPVRELADACAQPTGSVAKRRSERGDSRADYELIVLFLAYTGVRFGEMAALRVRRLDPLARRVEIAESVTAVNGVLIWGTPKGHARRWVSVPGFIAVRLAEHVNEHQPDDVVFSSPHGDVLRAETSVATCSRRRSFKLASSGSSRTGCVTRRRASRSRPAPM